MSTYTVWTLDVWGNETDGFDVNDRCKVGTIELDDDASDQAWLDALEAEGFLKPGSAESGEIDGSDGMHYINDSETLRPWLQLEKES